MKKDKKVAYYYENEVFQREDGSLYMKVLMDASEMKGWVCSIGE